MNVGTPKLQVCGGHNEEMLRGLNYLSSVFGGVGEWGDGACACV